MPSGYVMAPGPDHDLQVTVSIEVARCRRRENLLPSEGRTRVFGPTPLTELLAFIVDPIEITVVAAKEYLEAAVAVAVDGERSRLDGRTRSHRPANAAAGVEAVEGAVVITDKNFLAPVPVDIGKRGRGVFEHGPHVSDPLQAPVLGISD